MVTISEETKLRLRERLKAAQVLYDQNQKLIAAFADTIDYFNTNLEPADYIRLGYIRNAFWRSQNTLEKTQQDLLIELKALQAALILHPTPEDISTADNLDTYSICFQHFLDTRAGKAYLEAQLVDDLDSALDCLKAHLQSTTHTKVKRNETDEKTI
jgi:hypothetical protein